MKSTGIRNWGLARKFLVGILLALLVVFTIMGWIINARTKRACSRRI